MWKLFNIQRVYWLPDNITSGSGSSGTGVNSGMGSGSKQDFIDILNNEDEPEVIDISAKPDKESKKESKEAKSTKEDDEEIVESEEKETEEDELSEEEKELKLLEEELNDEPDEEKLELITPIARREILAKYPHVFKDFPYLEKAYYREQQFTELFPTIDEAKTAREDTEILDNFNADLMQGNSEKLLLAAKSEPESFNKFVDNLLPTLAKVDDRAYHHILGNVIKHTIASMVMEARESQNEVLQNAAHILNQYVFGSTKYTPPTTLSSNNGQPKSDDSRERELAKKEREIAEREFRRHSSELMGRVTNSVKATIESNIDPKQNMTDYVRRNAVREASEMIDSLIKKDNRFQQLITRLWQKAQKDDFTKSSLDAIRSAHVSKAKTLLPSVIKKARNEALRGMGKRVSEDKDEDREEKTERSSSGRNSERGRNTERARSNNSGAKDIPAHMSTLDFLMSDD